MACECPDFEMCAYRRRVMPSRFPSSARFMWILRYCMQDSEACARRCAEVAGKYVSQDLQPDGSYLEGVPVFEM